MRDAVQARARARARPLSLGMRSQPPQSRPSRLRLGLDGRLAALAAINNVLAALGRDARVPRSGAALGAAIGRGARARRSGEALGRRAHCSPPGLRPKKPHAVHGHDVGLWLALAPPSAIHGPHSEMNAICTAIKCGASKCEPHILPHTSFRSWCRQCGQHISALIQS